MRRKKCFFIYFFKDQDVVTNLSLVKSSSCKNINLYRKSRAIANKKYSSFNKCKNGGYAE
jgi:hypothetical protein